MITDKPYEIERKLFGYAVSQDPVALGWECASIPPNQLGVRAGDILIKATDPKGTAYDERSASLLHAGIQDTYTFYESVLSRHIGAAHREAIAAHPTTMHHLVRLAMHNYLSIDTRLGRTLYADNAYVLSENDSHISSTRPDRHIRGEGCPFAGNNVKGEVDPLFQRFGRWATQLVFSHHDAFTTRCDATRYLPED